LSEIIMYFFSSIRRHTRFSRDWSSDVCSSDLTQGIENRIDILPAFAIGLVQALVPVRSQAEGFRCRHLRGQEHARVHIAFEPQRSEERRGVKERRCCSAGGLSESKSSDISYQS